MERLSVSKCNVRRELEDISELKVSIEKEGILQPILVRPSREGKGFYEVVVGRKRFEAALQLGLTVIPAIVKDLSDDQARLKSLVENIQRQSLSPMEEAEEIQSYWEKLGSLRRISELLGISHTYVAENLLKSKDFRAVAEMLLSIDNEMYQTERGLGGLGSWEDWITRFTRL